MADLFLLWSLGETMVLVILAIAVLRLRGRLRGVHDGSTATLLQMRDVVQEAQALSTLLASQLATQAKELEATPSARRPLTSLERPAGQPAAKAGAATATRPLLPDAADLDRAAARERGMDPLGLALQRSLRRGAQPAT